jgi:diaminopimelate epimerase
MSDDGLTFWKGHALGNDYIVLAGATPPSPDAVRGLCDRHRGVGADGVLVGDTTRDPIALRILNPDGGEAEKSGNGLRIFAAWLHHRGLAPGDPFRIALPGEVVEMAVEAGREDGRLLVRVDMGTATFSARDVHFTGAAPADDSGERVLDLGGEGAKGGEGGEGVRVHLVSMGNPHCVVFHDPAGEPPTREALARLGPTIQGHPAFARGVNVQLARVTGPAEIEALIWERGAGETLASGSSACAVAAAAVRSGRVEARSLRVRMPGGSLDVRIDDAWRVRLTGPAQIVYEGRVAAGVLRGWERGGRGSPG